MVLQIRDFYGVFLLFPACEQILKSTKKFFNVLSARYCTCPRLFFPPTKKPFIMLIFFSLLPFLPFDVKLCINETTQIKNLVKQNVGVHFILCGKLSWGMLLSLFSWWLRNWNMCILSSNGWVLPFSNFPNWQAMMRVGALLVHLRPHWTLRRLQHTVSEDLNVHWCKSSSLIVAMLLILVSG